MFSLNPLSTESYPIATIKKNTGDKQKELIYFTEKKRGVKYQDTFHDDMKDYTEEVDTKGYLILKEKYAFEMAPTISQGGNMPRMVNYYLSASNSGKSYQIAKLVEKYSKMFPDNLLVYCSANDISADKNYDKIRDDIHVINPFGLEGMIDFNNEELHNAIFIFDDCDSDFVVSADKVDERLTEEYMSSLSVKEKNAALRMVKQRGEIAATYVKQSIISFLCNGRKFKQSVIYVGHKANDGTYENKIVNESTGVVLFPASMSATVLSKFMQNKLCFEKEQADEVLKEIEWFKYDWLYVSHKSSKKFIIAPDRIKIFK